MAVFLLNTGCQLYISFNRDMTESPVLIRLSVSASSSAQES